MPYSSRRLWAALLCLVAGLAAAGYLAWFWARSHRPGMLHYRQGMEYLSIGRPEAAEEAWIEGTEQDPDDYHCYAILGDYYSQLQRFADAATCYHAASDHAPGDGSLFLRWAEAEQHAGQMDQALVPARRAALLLSRSAEALGLYGVLLARSSKPAQAAPYLRRAAALRPSDTALFHSLVSSEMDIPDYAAAARDLAPYLKSHPNDAQACLWMATVLMHTPHTPETVRSGINLAERAVRVSPGNTAAYSALGDLYLDANQPQQALSAYLAGNARDPNSEPILRGLSSCYARLGRTRELADVSRRFQAVVNRHDRIDALMRLVSFNRRDVPHALELARLIVQDDRLPLALELLSHLAAENPNDGRVHAALLDVDRRIAAAGAPASSGTASPAFSSSSAAAPPSARATLSHP